MSIFAKIQIALAIIFVVFECVAIQLCHSAAKGSQAYSDMVDIVVGGLLTYLILVLIMLGFKKIKELHERRELKNAFNGFIFLGVLVFIYQFVYQILIVLGVDQKTAKDWPVIVFAGIFMIFAVVVFIVAIVDDLRKNNIIK